MTTTIDHLPATDEEAIREAHSVRQEALADYHAACDELRETIVEAGLSDTDIAGVLGIKRQSVASLRTARDRGTAGTGTRAKKRRKKAESVEVDAVPVWVEDPAAVTIEPVGTATSTDPTGNPSGSRSSRRSWPSSR